MFSRFQWGLPPKILNCPQPKPFHKIFAFPSDFIFSFQKCEFSQLIFFSNSFKHPRLLQLSFFPFFSQNHILYLKTIHFPLTSIFPSPASLPFFLLSFLPFFITFFFQINLSFLYPCSFPQTPFFPFNIILSQTPFILSKPNLYLKHIPLHTQTWLESGTLCSVQNHYGIISKLYIVLIACVHIAGLNHNSCSNGEERGLNEKHFS